MRTKGYLMVELLFVMMIMLSMSALYLPRYFNVDYDDYCFGNNYSLAKSQALLEHKNIEVPYNANLQFPIYFSSEGNVNKAQTIQGCNHLMVIHLGNGYLTYEK